MKLISMTDFVLEESTSIESVYYYAKFLKQPLTLSMFVPCDEEGNVLEEPKGWSWFSIDPCRCEKCAKNNNIKELDSYKQAKERVLFEINFEVSLDFIEKYKTIEELTEHYEFELTETAIKQIGL